MNTFPFGPHVPTHHVPKSSSPCRTSLFSPMWFLIRSLTTDISGNQSIATHHPTQQDTHGKRCHACTPSSHTNKGDPKHSSYHLSSMPTQYSGTRHGRTLASLIAHSALAHLPTYPCQCQEHHTNKLNTQRVVLITTKPT